MGLVWNKIGAVPVEMNKVVLLGNHDWIDPDFNELGVCEGYYQQDEGWIGSVWNPVHDCWDTKVVEPTYWAEITPLPDRE